jgi:5'-methylthioadenosine phosphorylase
MVAHISVAEPFCRELCDHLYKSVLKVGGAVHKGGTFLIEEGTRFATKAESNVFRQWGCSLIGMTTAPEAFLAREAEIAYATIAHITDYDSWHTSEEPVTVEMVIATMQRNIEVVQMAIAAAVENLDENADCDCHHALKTALLTDRNAIPQTMLERLKPIVGQYFPEG